MGVPQKFSVSHVELFPKGAWIKSADACTPKVDGNGPKDSDGNLKRDANGFLPQALCPETGLPLWEVRIIDGDADVRKSQDAVVVKVASAEVPVLTDPPPGLPFGLVEFDGLEVKPWVQTQGKFSSIQWSISATGFRQVDALKHLAEQAAAAEAEAKAHARVPGESRSSSRKSAASSAAEKAGE